MEQETMTFAEALEACVVGKKCRRIEWEDANIYIKIINEQRIKVRINIKWRQRFRGGGKPELLA